MEKLLAVLMKACETPEGLATLLMVAIGLALLDMLMIVILGFQVDALCGKLRSKFPSGGF